MEFVLTDHKYHILTGSEDGLKEGRKVDLVCNGCNKPIVPTGFAICKTLGCGTKINISKMDSDGQNKIVTCPQCGKTITFLPKEITWTTIVVSRHRQNKHIYYTKRCYSKKFI